MPRITPATRIAITLGFVSATLVWIAHGVGLIPSPNAHVHEKRLAIIQTLAGSISGMASAGKANKSSLQRSVDLTTRVNKDVLSIGVRGKSRYLAKSEDHDVNWKSTESEEQSDQAELELFANKKLWGTLEVRFGANSSHGYLGFLYPLSLVAFVSLLTTTFSWWVLKRSFRYLDPSKVVPKRVRSAFDTLTEGLVLIDGDFEIAHANKAFGEILNIETGTDSLVGKSLNELGWETSSDTTSKELPWLQCLNREASVTGEILEIGEGDDKRKFFVNSAPIFGNDSVCRGAMISFDDVTEMEQRKGELAELVKTLRSSRDEVERQNEQLTFLASYDPLTECMNRRAFWIEFEKMWTDAEPDELSLMMIDVDHFKSCNDTYGHSFGDLVLQGLGKVLRDIVPEVGLVSRFGGEEFVVALTSMSLDEALELTHTIHKAISDLDIEGKSVTASIGFSNREFKAMDGQHMLDQADISLYAAKRGGRNRVMRFDECEPGDALALEEVATADATHSVPETEIPPAAVEGFLKAVGYRCKATADHSRRVARLCASVGKKLLKPDDVYRLEVAAQLHEVGKLGVPDSILNKSSQLSTDDLHVIDQQKRIGLQLAKSVFVDSVATKVIEANQIFENQQSTGQGDLDGVGIAVDETLETSVAILAVCDNFDALIHGSYTRTALKIEDALTKIRGEVSTRFRADVVEELVAHVEKYGAERQLSRGGGVEESWPPILHTPIEAKPSTKIESAVSESSSSSIDKLFKAEDLVGTSLDQEISSTVKLANELLGLSDEVRTVADKNQNAKVDDQKRPAETP